MTVSNGSEPRDTGGAVPDQRTSPPEDSLKPSAEAPSVSDLAAGYAEKAGLHRNSAGHVDMLKSAGGCAGNR